jgi:hypothetical protein
MISEIKIAYDVPLADRSAAVFEITDAVFADIENYVIKLLKQRMPKCAYVTVKRDGSVTEI